MSVFAGLWVAGLVVASAAAVKGAPGGTCCPRCRALQPAHSSCPSRPTAYAPLGLSSEPDAATLRLPPAPAGRRHVLVVASDGLWEVVGGAEAVAAAAAAGTPAAAAAALADLARRRGVACRGGRVLDDCTVAVAFLA